MWQYFKWFLNGCLIFNLLRVFLYDVHGFSCLYLFSPPSLDKLNIGPPLHRRGGRTFVQRALDQDWHFIAACQASRISCICQNYWPDIRPNQYPVQPSSHKSLGCRSLKRNRCRNLRLYKKNINRICSQQIRDVYRRKRKQTKNIKRKWGNQKRNIFK